MFLVLFIQNEIIGVDAEEQASTVLVAVMKLISSYFVSVLFCFVPSDVTLSI